VPKLRRRLSRFRQIAGLVVDTWIPDSQTPGPWPIVLFSHHYRGCNTQSSYLMQALAGAG
jgi:hypothetical protein